MKTPTFMHIDWGEGPSWTGFVMMKKLSWWQWFGITVRVKLLLTWRWICQVPFYFIWNMFPGTLGRCAIHPDRRASHIVVDTIANLQGSGPRCPQCMRESK